jgi:hypothetical protein
VVVLVHRGRRISVGDGVLSVPLRNHNIAVLEPSLPNNRRREQRGHNICAKKHQNRAIYARDAEGSVPYSTIRPKSNNNYHPRVSRRAKRGGRQTHPSHSRHAVTPPNAKRGGKPNKGRRGRRPLRKRCGSGDIPAPAGRTYRHHNNRRVGTRTNLQHNVRQRS